MKKCETIGCQAYITAEQSLCVPCTEKYKSKIQPPLKEGLATKYPKYYKSTQGMTEVDVYAVHSLFDIQDSSGAIQHASKKLLLSGVRTGNKTKHQDITEARDTLNRWLELNKE